MVKYLGNEKKLCRETELHICGYGGMADAPDSGSGRGDSVQVQVLLPAPKPRGTLWYTSVLFMCDLKLRKYKTTAWKTKPLFYK